MPIRPRSGRAPRGAPQEIVLQFRGARMLEAEYLAALRIDAGHDVPDGAILAGGVHGLKNQQHRVAVGCVVKSLQRRLAPPRVLPGFLYCFFDLYTGFTSVGHFLRSTFSPSLHTEILRFDLHLHPFSQSAALPGAVYFRSPSGSSFRFSRSAFSSSSTARTSWRPGSS